MSSLASQLDQIASPKILVVGDLILDRYTFGYPERVSPEAPVLVLRADAYEVRPGGAASVAFLLQALGAKVSLAGIVGDDAASCALWKTVEDAGIDICSIHTDPQRPTTTKERFVGRAAARSAIGGQKLFSSAIGGQQVLRVDSESREPISRELETSLLSDLRARLDSFDALLISDYAKGACTRGLVAGLIDASRGRDIPVLVDPARVTDYSPYRRATLVKPNRAEAELATSFRIRSPQDALIAAGRLCRQHEFGAVLVTLDRDGMALVQDDDSEEAFPTEPREVSDVTGAGDMVLATLGLCLASPMPLPDAIRIANVAAGLEVERFGIAAISRDELRRALSVPAVADPDNHEIRNPNSEMNRCRVPPVQIRPGALRTRPPSSPPSPRSCRWCDRIETPERPSSSPMAASTSCTSATSPASRKPRASATF